jgi:tetratricopeptide (TPR) repeat protein
MRDVADPGPRSVKPAPAAAKTAGSKGGATPEPTAVSPFAIPFFGRGEAKSALDAAFDRAIKFQSPQFVTVVAPLGLGKTRLLVEWATGSRRAGFRLVRAAPPAGDSEPFALLGALLRHRFGVAESASNEDALASFRNGLRDVFGDRRVAEVAGLLGRYMGLAVPDGPLAQLLATRPEQETELARAAFCRFLEADAAGQPLVLLLDDVHRADDQSLEVIERLAGELGAAAIVICAAARPELAVRRPGWGRGAGSQARIDLPPLSRAETDGFIKAVLGADILAPGLVERAVVEASGNPFLLGQLLRLYRQHGVLVAETGQSVRFDERRAEFLSLSLDPHASAAARMAQLGKAEREVLARAAAVGRVFWTGALVALGRLGAEPPDAMAVFAPDPSIEEVRALLVQLAEADFIVAQASSSVKGEVEWSFCHELERVALLAGLAPEQLRTWRLFAAQWLEGRPPKVLSSEWFERLGTLYQDGGDERRAGQCFLRAGDAALSRLRHERARGLLARGLELLGSDDSIRKLDATHKLGDVCARTGRNDEALLHFGEMLRIAWRLDLPAKGGAAHARIGRLHRAQGELPRALHHLGLARVLFELAGDEPGIAGVNDDIGRVHFLRGNYRESLECHRRALMLRDRLGDARGRALTLSWMGLAEMNGGECGTAATHFREALAQSRTSRDAHGIVFSLLDLGRLEREASRPLTALELLEEARALARQMGERLYECHIGLQIADCLLAIGDPTGAERELEAVKATAKLFGARRLSAEAARAFGEARLLQGDALGARDSASAAIEAARSMGIAPTEGAALRVLASAVAQGAPGDSDQGGPREIFDRSVELLERVGAELELGRALGAYADYEADTGRDDAAVSLRVQAEAIRQRTRTLVPAMI